MIFLEPTIPYFLPKSTNLLIEKEILKLKSK